MVENKKTNENHVQPPVAAKPIAGYLPEDGLGVRVKTKRAALGLTHDGLSDLTKIADKEGRGISRTSIRGYELGTYKPGARELRILCLALEVSPAWLLLGESDETKDNLQKSKEGAASSSPRWFDIAMPLLAYSQLAAGERKQVRELVETLYRLQIGEVKFRSMRAFLEDFIDTIQDVVRDAKEHDSLASVDLLQVLTDTVEEMRTKHGDEEADLLTAVVPLLLPALNVLKSKNKAQESALKT